MELNLPLLFLITVFCTVTSSLAYKKQNDAAFFRRRYHIPKKTYILSKYSDIENLDIKPITVNPELYKTQKIYHKRNKKLTSPKEKTVWVDSIDWGGIKKLLLYENDLKDAKEAVGKAKILQKAKARETALNRGFNFPRLDESTGVSKYHIHPFRNILGSGSFRRQLSASESSSDRSSEENANWKQQWQQRWLMKKYEAINSSRPRGDQVNIVAARPWGVPCGDPRQHDVPWGSCMLAMECEAEFRIYRGDAFCGRSEFVCCAIQLTNYDMYQGIDPSFEEQSLSTDSEEKRNGKGRESEKAKKRRVKEKKKRKEERERRKKKIKRIIAKTVKEIKKTLNKAYSNGTKERQRKSRLLKKLVKQLKRKYKKDRQSIKALQSEQMLKIDTALMEKLQQVKAVNEHFMQNQTFANIIVNGTISENGARMLVQAYPDLSSYFKFRRFMWNDEGESREYLDDNEADYELLYKD